MEIIFLGTGGCVPTEDRGLPATAIDYLGELMLFDCGEGTQRQMRIADLNFMRLNHVFLTHLHADHYLGLGGMIQSMEFLEREKDLNIYGPPGTKKTIEGLISLGTFNLKSFKLNVLDIEPGIVFDGKKFQVTCTKSIHTKGSLAYCVEEKPKRKFLKKKALDLGIPEGRLFSKLQKGEEVAVKGKKFTPDMVLGKPVAGRKVVISGDTRYSKNIVELAGGADVLIHEATYSVEDKDRLVDCNHSTTQQAAETALKADVKQLYMVHLSQRYTEPEKLEEEARKIFPESYVAKDFQKIKIESHW
ncbi:MAG: ribonuclease Z [Candidatus Altiarchaeota archaeon]